MPSSCSSSHKTVVMNLLNIVTVRNVKLYILFSYNVHLLKGY